MIPDKEEQEKTLINFDNICMFTYLIAGVLMLTYADSFPKFVISGVILSIGVIMYYIIYIKKQHLTLTGDLNE